MTETPVVNGTRDKILIAAAEMLSNDPTARLSVRGVAARAGVSTGSLRHFFPAQHVLLDTVVAGLADADIPDDPIRDMTRAPAERLIACLHLVLDQVGTGEHARAHWRKLSTAFVDSTPSSDGALAYDALDELGRLRLERWLTTLAAEGAISGDDIERHSRFLTVVLNGLVFERALSPRTTPTSSDDDALRTAVRAVTGLPV